MIIVSILFLFNDLPQYNTHKINITAFLTNPLITLNIVNWIFSKMKIYCVCLCICKAVFPFRILFLSVKTMTLKICIALMDEQLNK